LALDAWDYRLDEVSQASFDRAIKRATSITRGALVAVVLFQAANALLEFVVLICVNPEINTPKYMIQDQVAVTPLLKLHVDGYRRCTNTYFDPLLVMTRNKVILDRFLDEFISNSVAHNFLCARNEVFRRRSFEKIHDYLECNLSVYSPDSKTRSVAL
jgi:hypothetical protein